MDAVVLLLVHSGVGGAEEGQGREWGGKHLPQSLGQNSDDMSDWEMSCCCCREMALTSVDTDTHLGICAGCYS